MKKPTNTEKNIKMSKSIVKTKSKAVARRKKKKSEDLPLYHAIQIGASYNPHTGKHSPMNLYISDEMLKASERDRLRRLGEAEKIKEKVITIKPENDRK